MKKNTILAITLFASLSMNATSIADALAAASTLGDNTQTSERYTVSGKVVYSNISTQYGNADFVIEDGADLLYCWRTFDLDSAKFSDAAKVKVSDNITVYGALKRYDKLALTVYPAYTCKIEMSYGYLTKHNDQEGIEGGTTTTGYKQAFTIAEVYNYYDYLSDDTEDITIYLYNDPESYVYTQLDLLVAKGTGLGDVLPVGTYTINDGITVGSAYFGDVDDDSYPIGCWAFNEGEEDYWDMASGTVTVTKDNGKYTIDVAAIASDGTSIEVTYTGAINIEEGEYVGINNVTVNLDIFTRDGKIIIPSESGQKIAIYNIMGQEIFNTIATSVETTISNLSPGQILLVRVGEKVAKIML